MPGDFNFAEFQPQPERPTSVTATVRSGGTLTRAVIRISGGLIQNESQATRLLIIAAAAGLLITGYFLFRALGGPPRPNLTPAERACKPPENCGGAYGNPL